MLRDIINTQNAQITFMRSYLTEVGAELVAEVCENDDEGDHDVPGYAIGIIAVLAVLCLVFLATLPAKAHGTRKQKQQQEQDQTGNRTKPERELYGGKEAETRRGYSQAYTVYASTFYGAVYHAPCPNCRLHRWDASLNSTLLFLAFW